MSGVLTLRKRIIEAVKMSIKSRDKYADEKVAELIDILEKAENEVKRSLHKNISLFSSKTPRIEGLKKLQGELKGIMSDLKKEQTLFYREVTPQSFKNGIKSAGQGHKR